MADTPRVVPAPPYAKTRALLDALIHVESAADGFARDLRRLQESLQQLPPPPDFHYIAPPDEHDDEESRNEIEARRAEATARYKFLLRPEDREKIKQATLGQIDSDSLNLHSTGRHHYRLFDTYHRDERDFRRILEVAKLAARDASLELDDSRAAALARDTSKLKHDLQNLGGVVPAPMIHGDHPPLDPTLPDLILEVLVPIREWVNKIRALLLPDAPAAPTPQRDGGGDAPADPGAQVGSAPDVPASPRLVGADGNVTAVAADARSTSTQPVLAQESEVNGAPATPAVPVSDLPSTAAAEDPQANASTDESGPVTVPARVISAPESSARPLSQVLVEEVGPREVRVTGSAAGVGHTVVAIRGKSLAPFFRLVRRLSHENPGADLVRWETVESGWHQEHGYKGKLLKPQTLRDYGRRIKRQLDERGFGHLWEQDTLSGVRWKG